MLNQLRRRIAIAALVLSMSVSVSCTNKNPTDVTLNPTPTPSASASPAPTSNAVVTTFAGSTAGGQNGAGTTAKFNEPVGIAVDASGSLYVADRVNQVIRKIATDGTVSNYVGAMGEAGDQDSGVGGAKFVYPRGVAVDAEGSLYITEEGNNRIRKVTPQGVVSTFAGNSSAGSTDGIGTTARFYEPAGMAFDASGSLYIADSVNCRIRKVTPDGTVTTFAGSSGGLQDGQGSAAKFSGPLGLTVDARGQVFVADTNNNLIRKIAVDGTVTTVNELNFKDFDGKVGTTQLTRPQGVAVDASGSLYVIESQFVRKVLPNGRVAVVAGNGNSVGFADGIGIQAYFSSVVGVVLAPNGKLYVTDKGNHKIRQIQLGDRP